MSVNAHVSRRATQTFPFPVRDVLLCSRITVLLGHPKVNNMNDYLTHVNGTSRLEHMGLTIRHLGARAPNKKVVRLDVPVDEVFFVDGLYP